MVPTPARDGECDRYSLKSSDLTRLPLTAAVAKSETSLMVPISISSGARNPVAMAGRAAVESPGRKRYRQPSHRNSSIKARIAATTSAGGVAVVSISPE